MVCIIRQTIQHYKMDAGIRDDHNIVSHIAAAFSGAPSGASLLCTTPAQISQAPLAHMSMLAVSTETQQSPAGPPPAHASAVSHKPPDSFLDKGLLEAAAMLDSKNLKTMEPQSSAGDGQSSIPWAIQQELLQQYGQFMEKVILKQSDSGLLTTSNAITDTDSLLVSTSSTSPCALGIKVEPPITQNSVDAQRDVYRRMLNYSMSSSLAQQCYLSQYGYMQDRFPKSDSGQGTSTTITATSAGNQLNLAGDPVSQLPSIDSVLLNLSTKKSNQTAINHHITLPATSYHNSLPAYGLQTLANAAIEADPNGYHETNTDRRYSHRLAVEGVADTDSSNLSLSDHSASQMMSPPRNSYSHLLDTNSHFSIPAAHNHQYQSLYQTSKSAMGTLPGIHHFSALGNHPQKVTSETHGGGMQLPSPSEVKPSDLVAAAMKLKVEPSEREIADRTIQEKIAAHQLNAVQQQVRKLAANALAAGNIDAASLLTKLQSADLESELYRFYDAEALQMLQHDTMELSSDTQGKPSSRRKSRGRPTSIESLRDPLIRQLSTTSSISGNTSMSGDGENHTYDCEICGKQFSHTDRLRRHRKIHTLEKPYKCDICNKGFKEKCNLKHHRFIHTGEKPYKCDTCGKMFNQRSSLKMHQKVHTGEKPFKCELCEKPFAQKYLLRQHMKKHMDVNMTATHHQP